MIGSCRRAGWLLFVTALGSAPACAQVQLGGDSNPPRGLLPSGVYQADDIETVNPVTGALALHIPITSLPRNQGGGDVFSLDLFYNSPFYNDFQYYYSPTELIHNLVASPNTGWRYSFAYSLELEGRPASLPNVNANCPTDFSSVLLANQTNYGNRLTLVLPDGSRHLLRMRDYSDTPGFNPSTPNGGDGYYALDPHGDLPPGTWWCPSTSPKPTPITSGYVNYYTTDGSNLTVVVYQNYGLYQTNHNLDSLEWTLLFPDGSSHFQEGFAPGSGTLQGAAFQICTIEPCYQITSHYNRHGKGWSIQNATFSGEFALSVQDDVGRNIQITHAGNFMDIVAARGTVGQSLAWTVNWGTLTGLSHDYYSSDDQQLHTNFTPTDVGVISLTLPQQLCDPQAPNCILQYTFGYNSDNNGGGLAKVNHIQFPLGSAVSYSYFLDNSSTGVYQWFQFLRDPVTSKVTEVTLDYTPAFSYPCPLGNTGNSYCENTTYAIDYPYALAYEADHKHHHCARRRADYLFLLRCHTGSSQPTSVPQP